MKRGKKSRIYHLYQKEEEGRKVRVKRNTQGTEFIIYIMLLLPYMIIMIIEEFNMVPMIMSSVALQLSAITNLYYYPIFYEKEGNKYCFLLKKYLYVPVSLEEVLQAKAILYFSKIGKLYGINLVVIIISGMIFKDWIPVMRKATVLGSFFLLLCFYTCIAIFLQYRKLQ